MLTELSAPLVPVRAASPPKDDDKKKKKSSDKTDEGKWEMLTDAYGRAYW